MPQLTNPQQPSGMPIHKYRPYEPWRLQDRTWPDKVPNRAPIWCSIDLRDGNQALIDPMGIDRKRPLFDLLVKMGFKEIEVGYPTSCRADWNFSRDVIEREAIPDDVTIQVMTPIRDELIERTVEVLRGAPRAILQIYNPTSEVQRRLVFGMDRAQVKKLALHGAELALRLRDSLPGTRIFLQYATESYTQTEPDFALEVCNAVLDLWGPTPDDPARVVFPTTVECFPPHEFADRIEWMHRNLLYRDSVLLTLHPHNDRGTGVAATELGLLAGADRVEGTLFGNGERAGNVCLATLAMNLFSQGIDPQLDLSDIDGIRRTVERCYGMPVPPRHSWVGDFVYTSFAGPHQDAISKCLQARTSSGSVIWDIPYLPIDPSDVGRDYKALIRINSQSGKGGVAYLMRTEFGLALPRRLQIEFAAAVQEHADRGGELTPAELLDCFQREYLTAGDRESERLGSLQAEPGACLEELLRPHGLAGSILEVERQRPDGKMPGGWVVYSEVKVEDAVLWGAGVAATEDEALARSLRSAVHRALAGVTRGGAGGSEQPLQLPRGV